MFAIENDIVTYIEIAIKRDFYLHDFDQDDKFSIHEAIW